MKSFILIIVGAFLLLFSSCCNCNKKIQKTQIPEPVIETKEVEKIVIQKDTVTIVQRDTVKHYIEKSVLKGSYITKRNGPVDFEEFRGAWIASVANITWPSRPGLSTEAQKEEAVQLLEFLESHHYNAAILQVRPQADALYKSSIEPWSYFLTGEMGKAPNPYYDPLEFWIEEAHKRGIELHAWLNPYRVHHSSGKLNEFSIARKKPELVVQLANGMYWLDPALKETQQHSLNVVMEIVRNYDVDGIHFDDYFYPYDSYNDGKDFPDDKSWAQYKGNGGKLKRADWRRDGVNQFIQNVYQSIKKEKPHVKFGISPFGIWRPGYPESIQGYDQYDKLYADAKLWLNNGWIDYFTPQLYWEIGQVAQSFPILLNWWESENTLNRHIWPGLSITPKNQSSKEQEIVNQILITRAMMPDDRGSVHWSLSSVMKDIELAEALQDKIYTKKVLVPSSSWLCDGFLPQPKISISTDSDVRISWSSDIAFEQSVIFYQYDTESWGYQITDEGKNSFTLPIRSNSGNELSSYGVIIVNKAKCQSEFQALEY